MIDLDNGQEAKNKNKSSVHIHLAASGWPDEEMTQPRNVALVLKSVQPVHWIVSSAPFLSGSLLILAEHQVDVNRLSGLQQPVEVRSNQDLPQDFAVLIVKMTADLGPPVSYVKAPLATNSIEIVIGRKQQQVRLPSSKRMSSI